ncbi:MAG: thioesterase domain-containing protein, partial [Candidatus Rokuibacteriota bacterium]
AMARAHVDVVRRVWPSGPYVVAGFAHAGGLVAYELVKALHGCGQTVAGLVLIGAVPPHPGRWILRSLAGVVARAARLDPAREYGLYVRTKDLVDVVARRIGLFRPRQRSVVHEGPRDAEWEKVIDAYTPPVLDVPLALLWCHDDAAPAGDPAGRWRALVRSVMVVEIAGTYRTAVTEHLTDTARAFAEVVARLSHQAR